MSHITNNQSYTHPAEIHSKEQDDDASSIASVIGTQKWLKDKLDFMKELKSLFYDQRRTNLSTHLSKFSQLISKLWDIGMAFDDSDTLCYLLMTLPYEFEAVVIGYCNNGILPLEVVEARLLMRSTHKKSGKGREEDYPLFKPEPKSVKLEESYSQGLPVQVIMKKEPVDVANNDDDDGWNNGWSEPENEDPVVFELTKSEPIDFPNNIPIKKEYTGKRRGKKPTSDKYWDCDVCDKRYWSRQKFLFHTYTHLDEVSCKTCGVKFKALKDLVTHKKECLKGTSVCVDCGETIANRNLATHKWKHKKNTLSHLCSACGKGFKCKPDLEKHMVISHYDSNTMSDETVQAALKQRVDAQSDLCILCGKVYSSKAGLKYHMENKHFTSTDDPQSIVVPAKVECEICNKQMKPNSMAKHMLLHSSKEFVCNICGESFLRKTTLMVHTKAHGLKLPFACHICGRDCVSEVTLKRHIERHVMTKSHQCNLCEKAFTASTSLKRHQAFVHKVGGGETFYCEFCFKSFAQKYFLKLHIERNHKEQIKPCGICKKTFSSTLLLQSHLKMHMGESSFECTICALGFPSERRLHVHYQSETHLVTASRLH